MGKTESLAKFESKLCNVWMNELIQQLIENQTILLEQFLENWIDVCKKAEGNVIPISYIEISLLRSSLLGESNPEFAVELFNNKWFFGGMMFAERFRLDIFTEKWTHAKRELIAEAKSYMGHITIPMAERSMLSHIYQLDLVFANILGNAECWFGKSEDVQVHFDKSIQCYFSEYHRFGHLLFEG